MMPGIAQYASDNSDLPPGWEWKEHRLMTIYPPVPVEMVVSALSGNQPMGFPNPGGVREVRVNDSFEIEVWERKAGPLSTAARSK